MIILLTVSQSRSGGECDYDVDKAVNLIKSHTNQLLEQLEKLIAEQEDKYGHCDAGTVRSMIKDLKD